MKRLLSIILFLAASAFGQTLVQSTSTTCHSCTSQALAYPSNLGAGHTIVTITCGGTAHAPHNISSTNNTWTLKLTSSNGTIGAECNLWEQENSVAGADTVTATSGNADDIHVYIFEISGLLTASGFDASGTGADTTTNTAHSVTTSGAVAQSSEYALGNFFSWNVGTGQTFTAGSGFTNRQTTVNTAGGDSGVVEDQVLSGASGTQTASTTFGTTDTAIKLIATWKASGASTPTCAYTIGLLGVGCK